MNDRREFLFSLMAATGCSAIPSNRVTTGMRAEWLRGKWGLMVHWVLPGPQPKEGERQLDINIAAEKFKIVDFIQQIKSTNASWLIFTIGQNTGFYNSPNKVLDDIAGPGHCSNYDLAFELARLVKRAGMRFIAYMPGEIDNVPSLKHAFHWGVSQRKFEESYTRFLAEYGKRFGMLCDGWWIDGCYPQLWLPNSERDWPLWLSRLREGNQERAISFNDGAFLHGIAEPLTEGQDFLSGECFGITAEGPIIGRGNASAPLASATKLGSNCVPHILVPIDDAGQWTHTSWQAIRPPRYDLKQMVEFLRNCKKSGYGTTFNVGVYQEGLISNATLDLLKKL